jgi:hypothetical protein
MGGFHRLLGDYLREGHREAAAAEEYTRGEQACRDALRLAASTTERDEAQSCLNDLASSAPAASRTSSAPAVK